MPQLVPHNGVCVGLSARFSWKMWATPIFNPFTIAALTSRRVFSPLHPIASQDHPCTTGREPPRAGRRYLRAAPNLPFITVNKQNQFEAPLSGGSVIYNTRSLVPCLGRGVAAGAGCES